MTSDFAGTVVGDQKVCLSRADKFKFCRANFLEHQQRNKFDEWAGTEEGRKALIKHEKNAIQYSLNRLEILKNRRDDNNKRFISKKSYKRLKEKLETYLNDQK